MNASIITTFFESIKTAISLFTDKQSRTRYIQLMKRSLLSCLRDTYPYMLGLLSIFTVFFIYAPSRLMPLWIVLIGALQAIMLRAALPPKSIIYVGRSAVKLIPLVIGMILLCKWNPLFLFLFPLYILYSFFILDTSNMIPYGRALYSTGLYIKRFLFQIIMVAGVWIVLCIPLLKLMEFNAFAFWIVGLAYSVIIISFLTAHMSIVYIKSVYEYANWFVR